METETLNILVTAAIWRAEQLEGNGESAAQAWAEVSALEEKLAKVLPISDPEGRIARRGAVRAALQAGDYTRAQALAGTYVGEKGAPTSLKVALREMLDASSRSSQNSLPGSGISTGLDWMLPEAVSLAALQHRAPAGRFNDMDVAAFDVAAFANALLNLPVEHWPGILSNYPDWSISALFEVLLDEAHRELDHNPRRALEITAFAVGRILLDSGLADARTRGRAWKEHGTALYMTGRFAEALDAASHSRETLEDPALASDRATAMLLTAMVQNRMGDHTAAIALLDEAAEVFAANLEPARKLKALELRAAFLFDLMRYDDALAALRRALEDAVDLGDERELARIENNFGRFALKAGQLTEAKQYLDQAVERFTRLQMRAEVLRARWCRANVIGAAGDKDEAIRELQSVQRESEECGMAISEQVGHDADRLKAA